jgi:hypothetical protein
MKITPEVTVNQSVKSQNNASWGKLATKSATRQRKLQAQSHSCGAFLPFSGRFSSLSVQKSVGFNSVRAIIYPKVLAQEVLKEQVFCYELV